MKNNNDVKMTWRMRWFNRNITIINTTLQLLDIYILDNNGSIHKRFFVVYSQWRLAAGRDE